MYGLFKLVKDIGVNRVAFFLNAFLLIRMYLW